MRRSTDRILVSHAGTVPGPEDFRELKAAGPSKAAELAARLPGAVKEVVEQQIAVGIDVVNDGELSKTNFSHYAQQRLSGLEHTTTANVPGGRQILNIVGRDQAQFPGFHSRGATGARLGGVNPIVLCTGPLQYVGLEATQRDIANLQAAVAGKDVEAFLPAIAPGTIEHWLYNEYYRSDEEFLYAIADAIRPEYQAITGAGLILQIDDPDLPDGWQMFPQMTADEYRAYAKLRVEALNYALRDIPTEQIRLHVCWGSGHGPHQNDLGLEHLVDLILSVRAQVYSIEAANPRHEHEWRIWQETKLPEGTSLMPGVIGHSTDIVEHPRLVADRLERYASLVGKEQVVAGTDCGVGSRVGHPEIAWAKFAALAEGARIASDELWGAPVAV